MATQRQVAKHLRSNEHEVRELAALGVLTKPATNQGGWDLDQARAEYIRYLKKQITELEKGGPEESPEVLEARTKTADKLVEERARLAAEQAEKIALENRVRKRQLASIDALESYAAQIAGAVRAELEALPALMKNNIPHLRSNELAVCRRVVARVSDDIADFSVTH